MCWSRLGLVYDILWRTFYYGLITTPEYFLWQWQSILSYVQGLCRRQNSNLKFWVQPTNDLNLSDLGQETHMLLDQLRVLTRAFRAEYVLVSLFVERREIWTDIGGKAAIPTDYRILKWSKATFPSSCSSHVVTLIYIIINIYISEIKILLPKISYLLVKYTNKSLLFFSIPSK